MSVVLEDVSFAYFEDDVLCNVNITLAKGLVHLLFGRTGSGKTTLALVLAGLLKPRCGSVRIDGSDPAAKDFERSRVQLAFQFPESQIFEMTVEKELEYGLRNFGFDPGEIIERRDWALECVGLPSEMLPRDPGKLSFGERRKLALASIIALKPEYLMLDEPLAGLDWRGRQNLIDAIKNLNDQGLTTIILTHETDIISEIGDTVTIAAEKTVTGPLGTDDFLHPEHEPDHDLLPEYILALRAIRGAGLPVRGKPRRVRDTATAIAESLRQS
ncbi:MAG: ABC transporter ATP-binding protein [Candidatus Eisenbacteria bacterium]